jgi:hypothetical protein
MPRFPGFICFVCLLSATVIGCETWQDLVVRDEVPHDGETITICQGGGNSIPCGAHWSSTWEFRADGECSFSDRYRSNKSGSVPEVSAVHWQSKTAYQKCLKLLRQTRFFEIKKAIPDGWCGGTSHSISVSLGQKTNAVSYLEFEQCPKEVARIEEFLNECDKERTASKAPTK